MAVSPVVLIDTLDRYGFTGVPQETEYPSGTEGWDSYSIPWGSVLKPNQTLESETSVEEDLSGNARREPGWDGTGQQILASARRNMHLPPPADVDALAWYLPFHYFGLDWGIYIKEQSVFDLAGLIYEGMHRPRMTHRLAQDLSRMALTILYLHEALHHKVESFATRLEMARLQPAYRHYKDKVVRAVAGTDDHLEEAVACAEMLTRLGEEAYRKGVAPQTWAATKRFVKEWIPTLLPGYRLGLEHAGDPSRWLLQTHVSEASYRPSRVPTDWALADNMLRGFFDKDAIAHAIVPAGLTPTIPWLDTNDRLVSVSTNRLVKHIRKDFGYVEIAGRGKGGHRWFECPTPGYPSFPLPPNRESLSPVVLRTVAEALGYKSIRDLAQHC
ncbi:MAG: hypothetical protein WCP59_15090 [Actinomycetota bacterium]